MAGKTNKTKKHIIDLAITLIDNVGYSNISLRKLAKELQLTTGAFYKHFATKDELWLAVTQNLSQQIAIKSTNSLNNEEDLEEQILSLSYVLLSEFKNHPNLMEFLFFNPTSQSTLAESDKDFAYLKLIDEIVTQLIVKNNLSKNKQTLFIQLWSFIQGYGLLIKNGSVNIDKDLIKNTLNDFLRK